MAIENAVNTIARATRKKAIKRFVSESAMFEEVGLDLRDKIRQSSKIMDEFRALFLIYIVNRIDQSATIRSTRQAFSEGDSMTVILEGLGLSVLNRNSTSFIVLDGFGLADSNLVSDFKAGRRFT